MDYPLDRISRPVVVTSYQSCWPEEFAATGALIRSAVGELALRIDHIGSTSVPGLAAKDIVDMQVTLADLDASNDFCAAMAEAGFVQRGDIFEDHVPPGDDPAPAEWRKRYFREPDGGKRTHIHVREDGRSNQRYALLFRDYLRLHDDAMRTYELIKKRLAELFPNKIDTYLYIKDPACDLIMQSARMWAREVDWRPGPSDC